MATQDGKEKLLEAGLQTFDQELLPNNKRVEDLCTPADERRGLQRIIVWLAGTLCCVFIVAAVLSKAGYIRGLSPNGQQVGSGLLFV